MSANTSIELILSADIHAELYAALFTADGCENLAVLFCSVSEARGVKRLLARTWRPAPMADYRERLSYHLEITPAFFNEIVTYAVATRLNPVVVHSHPGADVARYSPSDDFGEARLLPILGQLIPRATVASALFTPNQIRGRQFVDGEFVPLRRVIAHGARIKVFSDVSAETVSPLEPRLNPAYDRQERALGSEGQERLESLRVCVVGAGGTGSAVLEQLARLGFRDIVIVDPDLLEESNVPRVWGSRPDDAKCRRPKVHVLAEHLRSIAPEVKVRALQDSVIRQEILDELRDRDLVFGCTDNHWSRAVLNRFAHQHLIPLVDMGVRLDAQAGRIVAAAGQVTVAGAGYSCLRCFHLIDPERVRVESMPEAERLALAAEGYVQGMNDPAPAVISLNTTVASLAVTTAISLFTNLTGGFAHASIRYDARTSQTFVVEGAHDPLCDVCSARTGVVALGDSQPVSAYD